jgi:hypothetical protein
VELPVLAGRSNDHGTATCFVPPEVEVPVAEVGDVVPVLPEEDPLVSLERLKLVEPPELLSEMTAKSTFPECGLIITSLIVPIISPDEDFTSALFNWLALTS